MEQNQIQLKEIYEFLREKNKINELCKRAGATYNTVVGTFEQPDFQSLKGMQIDICSTAITMVQEIKELSARAAEALSK